MHERKTDTRLRFRKANFFYLKSTNKSYGEEKDAGTKN